MAKKVIDVARKHINRPAPKIPLHAVSSIMFLRVYVQIPPVTAKDIPNNTNTIQDTILSRFINSLFWEVIGF
jgi:hypothetical protein